MKYSIKYVIVIAIIATTAISAYQVYWLTNVYQTFDANMHRDIQEALRASDFEEIVYRVEQMKKDNFGGEMNITVGADPETEKTTLKNESKRHLNDDDSQTNLDSELVPSFADYLKDEEAVISIGLNLQRGIHSGLDNLRKPYIAYLDSVLTRRLDSLGVHVDHRLLYIDHGKNRQDTLAAIGSHVSQADTFSLGLDINDDTEYQLLIPNMWYVVLTKLNASLLLSATMLLIIALAYIYIIKTIRRMKNLDEMKTDFTNNITHELKTPIAVAHAANDALLNFGDNLDHSTMQSYLKISLQQLERLSGLVEQILSLSMERRRNMKLTIETVKVKDVIDDLCEVFAMKTKQHMQLNLDINADLWIETDRMHFSNIVSNLIDNAIKYSKDDAIIAISASHADDNTVEIKVKDHGIGIPADKLTFIFDKFYRVPHGNLHNVKGYGLGLFYVKSITQRLGGSVAVQSAEGHGTTFTLTFPQRNEGESV